MEKINALKSDLKVSLNKKKDDELKESREFCRKGKGRSLHTEGPKTEKGTGTSSKKSGTRNLEVSESIRS